MAWSPCREEPSDAPQLEALVVDQEEGILYAAQEVIGIWKIPLRNLGAVVEVDQRRLFEPTKTFGAPFWAVPADAGEFTCHFSAPVDAEGKLPAGTIVGPGNAAVSGTHIQPDLEGLSIYYRGDGKGYLLASSQGDDTYHVFKRDDARHVRSRFVGTFKIEGAGATDGLDISNVAVSAAFPKGIIVVQNGKAPDPASTAPVGGVKYKGASQFVMLGWDDVAARFTPPLKTEPDEWVPRKGR
jgi:3-phytase